MYPDIAMLVHGEWNGHVTLVVTGFTAACSYSVTARWQSVRLFAHPRRRSTQRTVMKWLLNVLTPTHVRRTGSTVRRASPLSITYLYLTRKLKVCRRLFCATLTGNLTTMSIGKCVLLEKLQVLLLDIVSMGGVQGNRDVFICHQFRYNWSILGFAIFLWIPNFF